MRFRLLHAALTGVVIAALPATASAQTHVASALSCIAQTDAAGIDAILGRAGSPLAGEGASFVSEGVAAGIDPRVLVAIAAHETSLETYGPSQAIHNAFGLGPGWVFASDAAAIAQAARTLGSHYLTEGRITLPAIGAKWAPPGSANDPAGLNEHWIDRVGTYYAALGGDPARPILTASQESAPSCVGAASPSPPAAAAQTASGPRVVTTWGGAGLMLLLFLYLAGRRRVRSVAGALSSSGSLGGRARAGPPEEPRRASPERTAPAWRLAAAETGAALSNVALMEAPPARAPARARVASPSREPERTILTGGSPVATIPDAWSSAPAAQAVIASPDGAAGPVGVLERVSSADPLDTARSHDDSATFAPPLWVRGEAGIVPIDADAADEAPGVGEEQEDARARVRMTGAGAEEKAEEKAQTETGGGAMGADTDPPEAGPTTLDSAVAGREPEIATEALPVAAPVARVEAATEAAAEPVDQTPAHEQSAAIAALVPTLLDGLVPLTRVCDRLGVTPRMLALMRILAETPLSVAEQARHLGVSRPLVADLCARLEHMGLARRERVEGDRRRVRVALTDAGHKLCADATAPPEPAGVEAVLSRMTPAERAQLLRGLQALATPGSDLPD